MGLGAWVFEGLGVWVREGLGANGQFSTFDTLF
jgi:hypothetical protein